MSAFDGLSPQLIWKHFESLTKIPRCSGNEAGVAKFIVEWAAAQGYASEQDELGNLVVRVPASPGKEGAPTIVLQGHLDMVGEKDSSSPHDFASDPIPVLREGDYLTADGTTLGSDNGIGLAAAMAVADDPEVIHGPLELLCTVDEETGLTGAQGLKPGFVTGKTMLNLDSEEIGAVYVGCAGGADTVCTLPLQHKAASGAALKLTVAGYRGGHSGLDINTGRANAIQVAAWFLDELRHEADFGLCDLAGGDKHNAIPREAGATLILDGEAQAAAEKILPRFREDMAQLYDKTDPGGTITLEPAEAVERRLTRASRDALLDLLLALPHGVLAMSQAVEGLVETSTNLAVVRLGEAGAEIQESSRSSVMAALCRVQGSIFAACRLAGGTPESHGGYPGWQPNTDSAVLGMAKEVHQGLFGKEPEVKAIHAGLECGIIGEKMGGMDMLSFGPQIENPHSPSEQIQISTVGPFYNFLKGLLAALAG